VPQRIRVAVNSAPLLWVNIIAKLGPGVVLLQESFEVPNPETGGYVSKIDLLVTTSHPVIDMLASCGDQSGGYVRIEFVLHDSSIDAIVSSPIRI